MGLLRRCRFIFFEPRQQPVFSLASVLSGGAGLEVQRGLLALAPHLSEPVAIDAAMMEVIGSISSEHWCVPECEQNDPALQALLRTGLVLEQGVASDAATSDERLRASGWWAPAALTHWLSRWHGMDSLAELESAGLQTATGLRERLGPPPPATSAPLVRLELLPAEENDAFDELLGDRCTCRNFDATRTLPLAVFSRIMRRVFSATGTYVLDEESMFLKKNVPSAGGLHPIEAYVLVQKVDGLEPALYHYHPIQHGLVHLGPAPAPQSEWVNRILAGQHWFAQAHAMVIMVPRFERTYWKYREHPKAYRAITLDAGHLSQLLMMCATEQGLGAFVTAAINEHDIEAALGLDGMAQGPIAICGFGWRAGNQVTAEFDPAGRVWQLA